MPSTWGHTGGKLPRARSALVNPRASPKRPQRTHSSGTSSIENPAPLTLTLTLLSLVLPPSISIPPSLSLYPFPRFLSLAFPGLLFHVARRSPSHVMWSHLRSRAPVFIASLPAHLPKRLDLATVDLTYSALLCRCLHFLLSSSVFPPSLSSSLTACPSFPLCTSASPLGSCSTEPCTSM